MKHLGDITKINGADIEPVDVITAGSPCQDLSVAGKRAGLDGERSGLFMEQIRIIKEMREHERRLHSDWTDESLRPRYMVWENVYGAFSSNGGEDFRAVLEETAKVAQRDAVIPRLADGQKWPSCGYIMGDRWSIAWRGHDAQYWGVPQRRKRVCMVADFNGQSAPFILFDPQYGGEAEFASAFQTVADPGNESESEVQSVSEGMSGNSEPCEQTGEGTSCAVEDSVRGSMSFQERAGKPGGGKGILIQRNRTGALSTQNIQSILG